MRHSDKEPLDWDWAELAPLRRAFIRIKAKIESRELAHELAEDQLQQDLINRLPSAMQMFNEGDERFPLLCFLEGSDWEGPRSFGFNGQTMELYWINLPFPTYGTGSFFVYQPILDKLYPIIPTPVPAPPSNERGVTPRFLSMQRQPIITVPAPPSGGQPEQPEAAVRSTSSEQLTRENEATRPLRRRGPPNTHDWHTICGEIALRCHDQSGRIKVPKNEREFARKMLEWCRDHYDRGEPAESEMREAVKRVCAVLRKEPSR